MDKGKEIADPENIRSKIPYEDVTKRHRSVSLAHYREPQELASFSVLSFRFHFVKGSVSLIIRVHTHTHTHTYIYQSIPKKYYIVSIKYIFLLKY